MLWKCLLNNLNGLLKKACELFCIAIVIDDQIGLCFGRLDMFVQAVYAGLPHVIRRAAIFLFVA